jgi:hypothetical protein
MKEFKYIVAKYFFPKYAPEVVNWGHKLRGKNGHNKPIDFTDADKKAIKRGIKAMSKDLTI